MPLLAERRMILEYEDIHSIPKDSSEIIDGERKEMLPTGFLIGRKLFDIREEQFSQKENVATEEVEILFKKNPYSIVRACLRRFFSIDISKTQKAFSIIFKQALI